MDAKRAGLNSKVKILWLIPAAAAIFFLVLVVIVAFALSGATYMGLAQDNYFYVLPIVGIAVGLVIYAWLELVYRNFTYEIGKKEMIIRRGVITRKTNVIPYAAIQNLRSERSLLERMLGLATIQIETAASGGMRVMEILLPGIADKDTLINDIIQLMAKAKGALDVEDPPQEKSTAQLLGEILEELKGISSRLDGQGRPRIKNNNNRKKDTYEDYVNFKKR